MSRLYEEFAAKDDVVGSGSRFDTNVMKMVLTGEPFKPTMTVAVRERRRRVDRALMNQLWREKDGFASPQEFLKFVVEEFHNTPTTNRAARIYLGWFLGTTEKELNHTLDISKQLEMGTENNWFDVLTDTISAAALTIQGSHKATMGNKYEDTVMIVSLQILGLQEFKGKLEDIPNMSYIRKCTVTTGSGIRRESDCVFRINDLLVISDSTCANSGNPEVMSDHQNRFEGVTVNGLIVCPLVVIEAVTGRLMTDNVITTLGNNVPLTLSEWLSAKHDAQTAFSNLSKEQADQKVIEWLAA